MGFVTRVCPIILVLKLGTTFVEEAELEGKNEGEEGDLKEEEEHDEEGLLMNNVFKNLSSLVF